MAYIGKGFKDIATANIAVNTMVGDGSDTTLGLSMGSKGVGSVNDVSVFVGGIQQRPGTDFTLSGSTITFTTAPADGVKVVAMSHGDSWNNAPSDNTVTPAKLKDASVTSDKIIGLDAGKLSGSLSGSGVNLTNLNAVILSGTLPAIDGSALTGVGAYENETSEPTATSNKTLGTMWVNKTSGEMYILTDDTTNANVWTNVGDGTGNVPEPVSLASGGTLTTDGDYNVHTFNSSSQLIFSVADAPVEYLVIAGGGTGYRIQNQGGGGGGGAGGYRTATDLGVTAQSYTVTVGAGGAAPAANAGNNGNNSTFSTITSTGGGKGGLYSAAAAAGGSGGGTRSQTSDASAEPAGAGNAGGYSPVEGYAGASGQNVGPYQGAGGGGGASEAGTVGSPTSGGAGGDGRASSITGSSITRAGGGGGSVYSSGTHGAGGAGGGTDGTHTETLAAAVNTGSGSGGSERAGSSQNVGSGGSGVVIIRYLAR